MQLFLIGQISAEFNSRSLPGKPGRRRRQATAEAGIDGFPDHRCSPRCTALALILACFDRAPTSRGYRRHHGSNGGIRPICPEVSAIPMLMAAREEAMVGERYRLVPIGGFRRNELWY
jgi:hypothetical protein